MWFKGCNQGKTIAAFDTSIFVAFRCLHEKYDRKFQARIEHSSYRTPHFLFLIWYRFVIPTAPG
ncbi:hypothetical protein CUN59_02850 [Cuspidothrix issatschenkoi CHARLIE-1]|uniref:Uncharacterized protein n=1 Tax=Cuspidothrix issatschenkoi CHARLIE-1 TaxID=2052836 RepID=A0A2S6CYC8_9CYAN|nr:hypothetical protein CUN59_02850 [Cuspidothrix issatschenkoi CHARLIE-1]